MISLLNGSVIIRDDPFLIVDVNNVGYRVHAAQGLLSSASVGSKLTIFTYTHVREDTLELYGFSKYADLKLFESLIDVSGVGPKTAIGIFSIGSSDQIRQAIFEANVSFFTGVPRLGAKNAQKIIIELKDKLGGTAELNLSNINIRGRSEVTNALKTFGFTSAEIAEALRNVDGAVKIEEQIKLALKFLGR